MYLTAMEVILKLAFNYAMQCCYSPRIKGHYDGQWGKNHLGHAEM